MGEFSISKLRESGCAPVVKLTIFDSIEKLKLDDYILDYHAHTKEMYKEYIDKVMDLETKKIIPYLKALKIMENIDNQSFEREDSFLMAIYSQFDEESAIQYLLKQKEIDKKDIIEGHKILLKGTSSEDFADRDYRSNNETYVGYNDGGKIVVDYFPIDYRDIEEAIDKLLEFYHSDKFDDNFFIKAQIVHGLIATLQMFNDGNSRYGRILQNIKLYDLSKKEGLYDYDDPIIYGTRSYMPFRYDYRSLIKNLAINPSQEQWYKWFNFNLNRTEDTMYFLDEKLVEYKKVKL